MSVVIYQNKDGVKTLASDSISVKDGSLKYVNTKKLIKLDDSIYVGSAGNSDFNQYVKEYIKNYFFVGDIDSPLKLRKALDKAIEEYKGSDSESDIIIAVKGRVYRVYVEKKKLECCYEITDFDVYGIGYSDIAIGAILAGKTPKEAIELAATRLNTVSLPVIEYTI